MTSNNLLYLSRACLEDLSIETVEVRDAVEHLIRGRAESKAWNAPKAAIHPGEGRLFLAMLAVSDDPPFAAVKSLGLNPRNSARGLDNISALVTLLDSDTGRPLAVMDGNWITEVRTAGLSAVAASKLAKEDSSVAAFIGCGVQARGHLRAFADLFPLREIRAFGRGSANRDALCAMAEELGLSAVASASAGDAIAGADLVITSVPESPQLVPFLDPDWLEPGAFAAITDLARPWLPEGMERIDCLVIDDLEQESQMPDPMVRRDHIAGDLTGLVTGGVSGRSSADERTAFVFRGLALGDLALAALCYQRARASAFPSMDEHS
jgi:ornithine cyclodeaminase/alanine dehydrogenase